MKPLFIGVLMLAIGPLSACTARFAGPGAPGILDVEPLTLHAQVRSGALPWRHGMRAALLAHGDVLTQCLRGLLSTDRKTLLELELDDSGELREISVRVGLRLTLAPQATTCLRKQMLGAAIAWAGPAHVMLPVHSGLSEDRALVLVGLDTVRVGVPPPIDPFVEASADAEEEEPAEVVEALRSLWRGVETQGVLLELESCENLVQGAERIELGDVATADNIRSCAEEVLVPLSSERLTVYASLPEKRLQREGLIFSQGATEQKLSQALGEREMALASCFAMHPERENITMELSIEPATGRVVHAFAVGLADSVLSDCLQHRFMGFDLRPEPGQAGFVRALIPLKFESEQVSLGHLSLKAEARAFLWQRQLPPPEEILDAWLGAHAAQNARLIALLQAYRESGRLLDAAALAKSMLGGELRLGGGARLEVFLVGAELLEVVIEMLTLSCSWSDVEPCMSWARELSWSVAALGSDAVQRGRAAGVLWVAADRYARLGQKSSAYELLELHNGLATSQRRSDQDVAELFLHLGELELAAHHFERYALSGVESPDEPLALAEALELRLRLASEPSCPEVPLHGVRMEIPPCKRQLLRAVDDYGWRLEPYARLRFAESAGWIEMNYGEPEAALHRFEALMEYADEDWTTRQGYGGIIQALDRLGRYAEQVRWTRDLLSQDPDDARLYQHIMTLFQQRFCRPSGYDAELWDGTEQDRDSLCR